MSFDKRDKIEENEWRKKCVTDGVAPSVVRLTLIKRDHRNSPEGPFPVLLGLPCLDETPLSKMRPLLVDYLTLC